MVVYVCFDDDLRVPIEEKEDLDEYKAYALCELPKRIRKFKYVAYPFYTSKKNIPEEYKRRGPIKSYKIYDSEVYEAIKERERIDKLLKDILNIDNMFNDIRRRK